MNYVVSRGPASEFYVQVFTYVYIGSKLAYKGLRIFCSPSDTLNLWSGATNSFIAKMVSLPDGLAKELMGRLQAHPWTAVVVFVALAWVASLYSRPRSKYPTINDHAGWTSQGAKSDYVANARMLVIQGFRKVPLFL